MDYIGLGVLVSSVMSLAFSFVPGLSDWYNSHDGNTKRALMAVLLVVITLVVFGLGCAGIGINVEQGSIFNQQPGDICTRTGVLDLLSEFLIALTMIAGANQATHLLTPKKD